MSMQDIVQARMDRLDEPVKRTLRTAAVIGREFGGRLLARLVDPATELQPVLETLKHLELIHETRLFPDHYRGMLYDQYGAWPQALADYEDAQRLAVQAGDRFRVYLVHVWAGRAHAMAGNPSRGRALLEESMTLAAQLGTTFAMPCLHTFHTACLLALGACAGLLPRCHEAIRLAREAGDTFSAALAYRTLAETLSALAPADWQSIGHAMAAAIRLHQAIGNTPELARTYLCYARLLQTHSKPEPARAYLTQARDLFRHMGMVWDLAQGAAHG